MDWGEALADIAGKRTKVHLFILRLNYSRRAFVMANYFGAPIFESDFVVPAGTTTSPACTATQGDNAEGELAAATYYYKISSITAFGEQIPGTKSAGIVADATHLHIHLTWTADADAKLYMIWRSTDDTTYKLLDIIAAKSYDAAGTLSTDVAAYIDKGSRSVMNIKPLASGEQNIVLINRHPDRGVAFLGKVDDMGRPVDRLFSYVDLARTKDTYDYMLIGYLGMLVKYPEVALSVVRHAKLA